MAIATSTKEAKYTQGFCFRHDEAGTHRARQVVERSCAALATLMQELFVQVERQLSQSLTPTTFSVSQQHLLEQLAEVVRARPVVEQAMMTSVACAFAALEDRARGGQDNQPVIAQVLAVLKERVYEPEDLVTLLAVEEKIIHANNNNRPLLVHLNAQWVVVFGVPQLRLQNSPLGPATLTSGFVAGLMCVKAGIATKRLLFQMFEQHFLARLSVLLNGIALRLEEEGIAIHQAASFDESDAGPIGDILRCRQTRGPERMREYMDGLRDTLGKRNGFVALPAEMIHSLQETLERRDSASCIDMLSQLELIRRVLEPALLRVEVHHQETTVLAGIRRTIAEQLNTELGGKRLPGALVDFFSRQWPDVLFEVAVSHDVGSTPWISVMLLQQQLLQSVCPVEGEEQRKDLARQVPGLVKNLRERLEQAGYSLLETNSFFAQLKQLHLANVQQKLESGDFVTWPGLSPEAGVPTEVIMASEADKSFYEQARAIVG